MADISAADHHDESVFSQKIEISSSSEIQQSAAIDSPKVTQVHLFNIYELQDPSWNPWRYLNAVQWSTLSLCGGGIPIPAFTIWAGIPSADATGTGTTEPPWLVISGKRGRKAIRGGLNQH
jgi:hypothetical protein